MEFSGLSHTTGSNPHTIRMMNKKIIYNAIKAQNTISRVELAKQTNLRAPTVSRIIQELLEEEKIVCCGKGKGSENGGPLPELYALNTRKKYCLGLEIGHEQIVSAVLEPDQTLQMIETVPMTTGISSDSKQLLQTLDRMIDKAVQTVTFQGGRVVGLGITCAGLVDNERGSITLSNIVSLNQTSDISLADRYEGRYGFYTYVDNDINILLTAHKLHEPTIQAMNTVMCFGINKYPGVSLFSNGRLYRGAHNLAGNILLSGIPGTGDICQGVERLLDEKGSLLLRSLNMETREPVHLRHLQYAIRTDDLEMQRYLEPFFAQVGRGIASLQQLLDTDCILIFHAFGIKEDHPLFQKIKLAIRELVSPPYHATQIVSMPLEETTFAFSAARVIFHKIYQVE